MKRHIYSNHFIMQSVIKHVYRLSLLQWWHQQQFESNVC